MKFQDLFPKPEAGSWEKAFFKETKIVGETIPEIRNQEGLSQSYFYTQSEPLVLNSQKAGWKIRQRINTQKSEALKSIENCFSGGVNILEINNIPILSEILKPAQIGLYEVSLSQVLAAIHQFSQHQISWAEGFLPSILCSGIWHEPDWEQLIQYIQGFQKPLPISVAPVRNGGGTVVDEVTTALLAMDYIVQELLARNVSLHELANRIQLRFATGPHIMSEIAKYRAVRFLWNKFWKGYSLDTESIPAYLIAETTIWNSSPADPHTDILRATGAAFSSIVGTVDELLVSPCPESAISPVEFGLRIARNIQHILKEESYLAATADPSAGAHYPETLAQQIINQVTAKLKELNPKGNLKTLLLHNELTPAFALRKQELVKRYREKQQCLIGVTHYLNPNPINVDLPKVSAGRNTDFTPVSQTPIYFLL